MDVDLPLHEIQRRERERERERELERVQHASVRYRKAIAFRRYNNPEDALTLGRVHNTTDQTTNAYPFHTPDERVRFADLVVSFARGRFTGGCGMHTYFLPGAAKLVHMSTFNAATNRWNIEAAVQLCVIKLKAEIKNTRLHTTRHDPRAQAASPNHLCVSVTYPMQTRCQKLKFCRALLGNKLIDFLQPGTVVYYTSCVDVVPRSSNAAAPAAARTRATLDELGAAGGEEGDEAASDSSDEEVEDESPEETREAAPHPLSPSYSPTSPVYRPTGTPSPVPEQEEATGAASAGDDDDTFDAQWAAMQQQRAANGPSAGEEGAARGAEGARRGAEGARRGAAVTNALTGLRDLSDQLFALKETMPDESFRQLSDALMAAHNRVA